jgi:putative Mg2+ transporter-C (MgtC) family protein
MGVPDTTRIAAQVVTGVGFLCGGVIFKEGINIRGLNTAATIWCTAAIGVLCSSGMYFYASDVAAILFAVNFVTRFVAGKIQPFTQTEEEINTYVLSVSCREENEFNIRAVMINKLSDSELHLFDLKSADEIGGKVEIEATVQVSGRRRNEHIEKLTAQIALEKGINKAGWDRFDARGIWCRSNSKNAYIRRLFCQ